MNQAQNQVHDQDQGHVQDVDQTQSQNPSEMHEQTQEQIQSLATCTFAEVADFSKGFSPNFHILEHKPEVQPVFLGFKRVAREGYKIPLIQVAAAVGDVVGKQNIDAVQLIKSGWQIYVRTEADRLKLMSTRIELVGKSIDLLALVRDPNFTPNVKIILKDLPLNEVTNDRVLLALKNLEGVEVQSPVKYSNIFVDGHCTHLWNGDRFVYVTESSVAKIPTSLQVDDYKPRVIKPAVFNCCLRYQKIGHKANSLDCPARAPEDIAESIQVFKGGSDPLSNLHVCPEGCKWQTSGTEYDSVEKEFQHNKVQSHGMAHIPIALTLQGSNHVSGT